MAKIEHRRKNSLPFTDVGSCNCKMPVFKRSFDFILALSGIIVSLPLWLVIGIAIYLDGGRPILFRQVRLGKRGKIFTLYKFRSMIFNAEDSTGPVWANRKDHRVTRVGNILRQTRLDELPQLLNILRGDMSFVGPRPERPELAEEFKKSIKDFDYRLCVNPGLTGIAQVYGHYNTSPRNKLRYDKLYINNQSLWLDLKLILITLYVIIGFKRESRAERIDKYLGQIVVDTGLISKAQLQQSLLYQEIWGGKIGEIFILKGFLDEDKLRYYLNLQVRLNSSSSWKGSQRKDDLMIGETMLAAGIITPGQLNDAQKYQEQNGGKIGSILEEKGYITELNLRQYLKKQSASRGKDVMKTS